MLSVRLAGGASPARPPEGGDPEQQALRQRPLGPRLRGGERGGDRRAITAVALCLAGVLVGLQSARADSVEDFYKNKTISLFIGFEPGGGYDIYGRLLTRHLGKHIPGNPAIVAQNMPGAGSLRAAASLYSVAPKDGTAIATFGRTIATTPLLAPQSAQFDGTKFNWLGSITNEVSTCVAWHTAAVKNFSDLVEKPITLGGDGPGADPDVFALLYKNVFNAPIKLVSGYHGTNPIVLAMERGEVDGLCGYSWSTIKSRHQGWLKDKKLNILVQAGLKKDAELPNIPLVLDVAKTDEQRQTLKVILVTQEMARPFTAPPGVPEERVA